MNQCVDQINFLPRHGDSANRALRTEPTPVHCEDARLRPGEPAVMMVEGKVDEPFGPLLEEWLRDASDGKRERLAFLGATLGIDAELPGDIRYQLLHRAASPLIEAMRIGASPAAMVVHSFSDAGAWHQDYQAFARLMGADGGKGALEPVARDTRPKLWIGWVGGGTASRRRHVANASRSSMLPALVAHADWGANARKRWMCVAERTARERSSGTTCWTPSASLR